MYNFSICTLLKYSNLPHSNLSLQIRFWSSRDVRPLLSLHFILTLIQCNVLPNPYSNPNQCTWQQSGAGSRGRPAGVDSSCLRSVMWPHVTRVKPAAGENCASVSHTEWNINHSWPFSSDWTCNGNEASWVEIMRYPGKWRGEVWFIFRPLRVSSPTVICVKLNAVWLSVFLPVACEQPSTPSPGSRKPRGLVSSSPLQPWNRNNRKTESEKNVSNITHLCVTCALTYTVLWPASLWNPIYDSSTCAVGYTVPEGVNQWLDRKCRRITCMSLWVTQSPTHLLMQLQDSFLSYVSLGQVNCYSE